jgi:hypothetical protein
MKIDEDEKPNVTPDPRRWSACLPVQVLILGFRPFHPEAPAVTVAVVEAIQQIQKLKKSK